MDYLMMAVDHYESSPYLQSIARKPPVDEYGLFPRIEDGTKTAGLMSSRKLSFLGLWLQLESYILVRSTLCDALGPESFRRVLGKRPIANAPR